MNSVYIINKAVNRPMAFRGLKEQYIWFLGGGILGLLFLFAVLYIAGVPVAFALVVIGVGGVVLFNRVYHFNKIYGVHGWMKQMAGRAIPKHIACDQLFTA